MNKWERRLLTNLFSKKRIDLNKETDLMVENYESSLYKFKLFLTGFIIFLPITISVCVVWAEFENLNKIAWFIVSITIINLFSFFLTRMASYFWLYNIARIKLLKRKDEIQKEMETKEKKKEEKKIKEQKMQEQIDYIYSSLEEIRDYLKSIENKETENKKIE